MGTSREKLQYGQSTLQWMINRLNSVRCKPTLFYQADKAPQNNDFTSASLLYNNIDVFNLDDNNNLSWSQYFSLLALTIIQQSDHLTHGLNHSPAALCAMSQQIAEAMEAITISEIMLNDPCHKCLAIELSTKKVYSLKKARKSIRKLQLVNDLQSDLIRFWSKGKFNNRTEAARRYHDLVSENDNGMDRSKVIRKFTKTISEYEKAINLIIKQACRD